MSTNEFAREDRFIVIKRKDLEAVPDWLRNEILYALQEARLPERKYVVVESDWPEYETVWRMIESRVTGSDTALELEAPTTVGALILGGAVSSTELGDNDVTLDSQAVERLQRELVKDSEDIAVELMLVGQHYRILQALRAERDCALAAVDQLYSMLGVTDQVQAGERLGFLVGQSIMVPKLEAQLKRSTVYIEARQCDECQHGGINDSADGLAACHDCDWTGPDPAEDKCPGCHSENCMAAACPQCGARYVLVASEEIAAPIAQAGQVPEGWRVMHCTSSVPREGDQWEVYDPQGSGGVVSAHDVRDWVVRGLLNALADAPAQGMPTEAELEAAGLGYPLSKEEAVALWNDRTVVAPGGE